MTGLAIHRLDAARTADLFRLLACEEGCAWCACVPWHLSTWDGFPERTAEENRALRERVHARGAYDGYLAYERDGDPVGWCQVAPCDALPKAARDAGELARPGTWAITCFEVRPERRRSGVARALLAGVLADVPSRGAREVLAFPKRGADDPAELWNGPEAMFRAAGFRVARDDAARPVLALDLA